MLGLEQCLLTEQASMNAPEIAEESGDLKTRTAEPEDDGSRNAKLDGSQQRLERRCTRAGQS